MNYDKFISVLQNFCHRNNKIKISLFLYINSTENTKIKTKRKYELIFSTVSLL